MPRRLVFRPIRASNSIAGHRLTVHQNEIRSGIGLHHHQMSKLIRVRANLNFEFLSGEQRNADFPTTIFTTSSLHHPHPFHVTSRRVHHPFSHSPYTI